MVRAEFADFAPAELGPLSYDPDLGLGGLDIQLRPGGSLEGVVQDGDGLRQSRVVLVARGDGLVHTVRTSPDGHYRLDHLMPGPWMVRIVPGLIDPTHAGSDSSMGPAYKRIDGDCWVREGEVSRYDPMTGRFAARVTVKGKLAFEGLDPGCMQAELIPVGIESSSVTRGDRVPAQLKGTPVDVGGDFEVHGAGPGRYRLVLFDRTVAEEQDALRIAVPLDVASGLNEFKLELSFGRVRSAPGTDESIQGLLWRGPKGEVAFVSLPGEDSSRLFPAGKIARVGAEWLGLGDPDQARIIEEANLVPGGAVVLGP